MRSARHLTRPIRATERCPRQHSLRRDACLRRREGRTDHLQQGPGERTGSTRHPRQHGLTRLHPERRSRTAHYDHQRRTPRRPYRGATADHGLPRRDPARTTHPAARSQPSERSAPAPIVAGPAGLQRPSGRTASRGNTPSTITSPSARWFPLPIGTRPASGEKEGTTHAGASPGAVFRRPLTRHSAPCEAGVAVAPAVVPRRAGQARAGRTLPGRPGWEVGPAGE